MSEKTARQVRKESNQFYGNVIPFARTYTNQQIQKQKFWKRLRTAFRVVFKGRVF